MRYAYRLKGGSDVTLTYAAKAPATSALYDHLRRKQDYLSDAAMKEDAKANYVLIAYELIEQPRLESLQRDSNWLSILEEAGIDNAEAYSYACDLKREAIAEGRFTEDDFD